MAKTKKITPDAELVSGVDLSSKKDMSAIVWKAKRPLTVQEHEELSAKLRYEAEQTGRNIILVPFSVDLTDGEKE